MATAAGLACGPIVCTWGRMSARDAILAAFDELYDSAAAKLSIPSTPEERAEARARFAERFDKALELAGSVEMRELPRPVLDQPPRSGPVLGQRIARIAQPAALQ